MANVLIVDDDEDTCRPLVKLLQYVGHSPFLDMMVAWFVHASTTLRPDMILLTLTTPGLNGLDVLKTIRAHPMQQNLPVVVYSAFNDSETMDTAIYKMVQSYLVNSRQASLIFKPASSRICRRR